MTYRAVAEIKLAFSDALTAPHWASLGCDRVAVLLVDLAHFSDWLPAAGALLDPAQAARVQRQRFGWRRDELQLCYAVQRLLLGHVLRLDPASLELSRSAEGKPLLGMGNWQTSLSHTDGYAALAVTAAGAVGIDIELAARAVQLPEIASLVCHASEQGAVGGGETLSSNGLLELWVRKEAFLKAAGVGLARAMTDFPAPSGAALQLSATSRECTTLRMLDAGPHCVAALAAPPGSRVDCIWLGSARPVSRQQAATTRPRPAVVAS
jgi:4'-phosphopantetheinyl transferase